jgi:hypothetical protein
LGLLVPGVVLNLPTSTRKKQSMTYTPVNGSVDIIHTATTGNGFGRSTDEVKRFQTFVAPPHGTGTMEVCAKLRRVAGADFDAPVVELFATKNGMPSGSALASSSFCEGGIGTSTFGVAWTQLAASGLVPGATYALVLSTTSYPDPSHNGRYEWAVAPVYDGLHFGKWNGHAWVDEPGLGNGWLAVGARDADNLIPLTHAGNTGNSFGEPRNQIKRFQTFLARGDQPLVGVDVKLRKVQGSSQSDVVLELYACSGHKPTGRSLATAAIPASMVAAGWTVVHAPLYHPALVLEQEYAVVLSQRITGAALYEWAVAPVCRNTFFGKWNGMAWLDESGQGDGWLIARLMPPLVSTVDLLPTAIHGNGFGNSSDEIRRYQCFELAQGATVTGLDLMLRKFAGSTQSDVVGELYATTANHPSGSPLATGVVSACQVGPDWGIVHMPLKSPSLASGTYALVLKQRVAAPARYEWCVGPVAGGKAFGKWNGTAWVDESALGCGWSRVWTTAPQTALDLIHNGEKGYGFGNSSNELKRFQTFTTPPGAGVDGAYDLNGVQVRVRKVFGDTQSDLVAELYETRNNLPTGLPRTTAVIPAHLIQTSWTDVHLPLHFVCNWLGQGLASGKQYAVVLSQRTAGPARYEWAAAQVTTAQQFGKWDGTAWKDESGAGDGWLKVSLIWRIAPN